jgi:hypothetical protein
MNLRASSGECEAKRPLLDPPTDNISFLAFTGIWLVQILAPQQKYDYQKPLLDFPTVCSRLGKS